MVGAERILYLLDEITNKVIYQLIYNSSMVKTKQTSTSQIFKHPIDRYPRLDTVLMIEEAIRNAGGDYSVRQLWQKLPKKVMWQTYLSTLDYLEYTGSIMITPDKHPIWTKLEGKMLEDYQKGIMVDATQYLKRRS